MHGSVVGTVGMDNDSDCRGDPKFGKEKKKKKHVQ